MRRTRVIQAGEDRTGWDGTGQDRMGWESCHHMRGLATEKRKDDLSV